MPRPVRRPSIRRKADDLYDEESLQDMQSRLGTNYWWIEKILLHKPSTLEEDKDSKYDDPLMYLVKWEKTDGKTWPNTYIPEHFFDKAFSMLKKYKEENNLGRPRCGRNKVGAVAVEGINYNEDAWPSLRDIEKRFKKVSPIYTSRKSEGMQVFTKSRLVEYDSDFIASHVYRYHCYALLFNRETDRLFVADGLDMVRLPRTLAHIERKFKHEAIPLLCGRQKYADHCGPIACAIAIELTKSNNTLNKVKTLKRFDRIRIHQLIIDKCFKDVFEGRSEKLPVKRIPLANYDSKCPNHVYGCLYRASLRRAKLALSNHLRACRFVPN